MINFDEHMAMIPPFIMCFAPKMAEAVPSGSVGKGRPLTDINMDDVKYLLSLGLFKIKSS